MCGRSFSFTLHANHIVIKPKEIRDAAKNILPWFTALLDEERLQIFNAILAEYRERSQGDAGFKMAALGVTEKGDVYIAENTEQISSDFNRQCAEQNMVTISTQRNVYKQIGQCIRDGRNPQGIIPENAKFREIYLMGGRLPDTPISCPCGNCTDLLSKVMLPDSNLLVLPVNDGIKTLSINGNMRKLSEIRPGEAWKTTMKHLNSERHITLDEAQTQAMRTSMAHSLADIRIWVSRHAEEDPNRAVGQTIYDPATHTGKIDLKRLSNNDLVDLGKLKHFMYEQIMVTLANRLESLSQDRRLGTLDELSDEQIAALAEHVSVRCSVIQRDDGRLYAVAGATSPIDKAIPDAEISAIGAAGKKLGNQGIRQTWAMEFDMENAKGGLVGSCSKAAVERLLKRSSKITGQVDMGFFPFGSTAQTHNKAAESLIIRIGEDLMPGNYKGRWANKGHGR